MHGCADGVPFGRSRIRAYRSFTRALTQTIDEDADDGGPGALLTRIEPSTREDEDEVDDEDEGSPSARARAVSAEIDTLRREILKVQSALDVIRAKKKSRRDAHTAEVKNGAARRRHSRSLPNTMCEPTTRGMAIVLSQQLDEILPEGAIERKYAPSALACVDAFGDEFAILDGAFREGARQVGVECRDRGELLEVIRERYGELFSTMRDACDRWRRRNDASRAQLDELQCMLAAKERERVAFTEYVERCRRDMATAKRAHRNESERADALLSRARLEADSLATSRAIDRAEIRSLRERVKLVDAQCKHEISVAVTSMEDSLSRALDDRDRLAQRVQYLDTQLLATRAALPDRSAYETIETQTAALDAKAVKALLDHSRAFAGVEIATQTDVAVVVKRRRKGVDGLTNASDKPSSSASACADGWRREALGGFASLVSSQKTGRHKPRAWVLKCIAHVYSDKITLDATETSAHGDDTVPPPSSDPPLAAFVYDWHLHKFGLRQLAENNLLDLVASATVHARDCAVISQFGVFCGIITGEDASTTPSTARGTLADAPTVAFYLRLVDALANANPLSQLFLDYGSVDDSKQLDAGSDAGSISLSRVTDALKRVFSDFKEDGAALKEFVAKNLGVKHASSSSSVKFTPFMRAVMDEYGSRRHANNLALKSLFRAANVSDSGELVYDEFHAAFRVADAKLAETVIARAFQTFSTRRDKRTPASMHVDDFIKACLANGLDKFRVIPERVARHSAGDQTTAETSAGDDSGERASAMPTTAPALTTTTKSSPPSTSAAWLALLNAHMSSSDGTMTRLESLRQTPRAAPPSVLARCERQAARLFTLKSNPCDGEAAYLAYKILTTDVRAALVKAKGGFKRLGDVVLTRVCFSMRAASRRGDAADADASHASRADFDPFHV